MARNIVKDYLECDKEYLREYINTITEKKLNSKICDMIVDTYVNVRYLDIYEHIKKHPIDNIEYYVIENSKKMFAETNKENFKEKTVPLIVDALIILRYVILYEKYSKNENALKQLTSYEEKIRNKYSNTKVLITGLIKSVKDNTSKKEKYLNNLLSNDFSIVKKNTNIKDVYDLYFDNSVKMPDLFSDVAINRVYNSGAIYEDRMLVFYTLTCREILVDMEDFQPNNRYIVDFPNSLIEKSTKLTNLLKIIDCDYVKERIVLKVSYSDYLKTKDEYDKLIHDGYSLAVVINDDVKDNMIILNIFAYILIDSEKYNDDFKEFNNVILI